MSERRVRIAAEAWGARTDLRQAGIPVGVGAGDDSDILVDWIARGVNWLAMGGDCNLLLRGAAQVAGRVREQTGTNSQEETS